MPPTLRSRRAVLALVLAFSSFVASAATLTLSSAPASAAPGAKDTARNNQWTSFANSNGDWNGADGTIGVRLTDGRINWSFSDTYKGPIAPNNVRPPFQSKMVNNSMVTQSSSSTNATLTSLRVGGTGAEAETLVAPPAGSDPGSWLWTGDGVVSGTTMKRLYYVMKRAPGCEIFGQRYATAEATFDVSGQPRLTSTRLVGSRPTPIHWGTAVLDVGSHTYIYGSEVLREDAANPCVVTSSHLHIARVPRHDFGAQWSYFTNGSWTTSGQGSRVFNGVSSEFSVTSTGGKYVLVTKELFGTGIAAYSSSTPTGFNADDVAPLLFTPPENGSGRLVYAARLQPALTNGTTAVLSYNVNATRRSRDGCADENTFNATIYRPRFITVPVSALLRTDGVARSTLPSGIRDLRESDPTVKASGETAAEPSVGLQAATPFPVERISWGTAAQCRQSTPRPTGVTAAMNPTRTGATIEWDWIGPTMFTVVWRKFAWEDDFAKLPFMLVGAWEVPNVPAFDLPVGPLPATGNPTRVRLVDDWNGAEQTLVAYKVCFSRWVDYGEETCADPLWA